ncbi:fimbrial biogenesis outer membrane usher protein [Salmonella enterica subsp. enterica]|uniref:fimbria/pilus outer membrane usher protein n=1 Tax=Salmonella enterica TaxID=28901 RepID=UPI0009B00E03|nr:fimbria/pilus outer membrane usher protein [Salmonella enterica]ECH9429842.1 fimbrial biogenesis outer membrane usher protein [Salmonella enterica subsp. enterica]EAC1133318.1 fimbrial biogenesis outer membrane usher protein [Salmonella enterica subsp. enterica serovar Kambole]EBG0730915.1 fimbrial biogenesis outer membrane usher protein [Salmonella enterica subsp. enterica serovar Kambole]EBS2657557.1 fimbrial biogenesis outer membrane usher protein [Salmonella enterica subsp. enterica sero
MIRLRLYLALASGALLGFATQTMARDSLFNPGLLELDHPVDVDIHQFNRANMLPPGDYKVDIIVNGKFFEKRDVKFVQDKPDADLHPCFVAVRDVLSSYGVKVDALKSLQQVDNETCLDPAPFIDGSGWAFDSNKFVLNISIPQIYLNTAAYDYISPSRWDEGINAMMVNYDFSGSHTIKSDYGDGEEDNYYLNLRNGINLGAWRLRNYSTLSATGSNTEYHSISSYIQRDIAALRSQIMVGDTWTASDVFDSSQIRGVRLYTDNDMLPSSQNGFAPVVRGVAKSNATVIIRQNKYVIYQSAVPQGAFAITDLNTVSGGGDLDVTIKEEDGSEQHFTQPYASLAILKREGQTDVDMSVGELRDESSFTPNVVQAQILHGLPWGVTVYGGTQVAEDYAAAALGIGKDLGTFGAVSLDVTHARSHFNDGDNENGQSWRFLYSKRFDDTDTNFRLVGYRYSTEGFYSLSEWASRQENSSDFWVTGNRRSRVEGTWSQSFGRDWGNIYLTVSRQQYWQTDEVERLVQLGYSNSWRQISWNVSWNYTDSINRYSGEEHSGDNNDDNGHENIFMLSVSIPLSGWLENSYVNYSMTQNNHNESSMQAGIGGTLLEGHNLSYNVQESWDSSPEDVYSGNASMEYDGTYGSVNGSYAWNRDSQRFNYGVRGGILAHSGGVTFSQELGETVALVEAPGADGLAVENAPGVATDWRGYTVKTQLNPYDENRVAINSNYFSKANIELDNTVVNLVPTRGAVVKATFVTHVGYRVLFNVKQADGRPVPFGAMATAELDSGTVSGIVGDNGELYLSGMPESGNVTLSWGHDASSHCIASYNLNNKTLKTELIQLSEICR